MADVKRVIKAYWLWLVAALYLAGVSVYIITNPDTLQWDFKTYYYAGLASSQGRDPYLLGTLSDLAGQEIGFPFAYPPLTLPLFRLFTWAFEFNAAYVMYFILKAAALLALIRLWVKHFLPHEHRNLFPLVLAFGFSGTIYLDLVAGNISIFEQLGLWTAFWALRRQKTGLFYGLVVLVACFKITPILFLLLPLILEEGRKWKQPLIAFFGWLALQAASYALQPQLYENFLVLASKLDERMPHNPSSLALIRDISQYLNDKGLLLPAWLPVIVFLILVLVVAWFTWARLRDRHNPWLQRLFLFCLAYAVLMPRFKNYSFILLLVPAFSVLLQAVRQERLIGLALLLLSASIPLPFGLSSPASRLLWGYFPLLLTGVIWWLAVQMDRERSANREDPVSV